MSEAWWKELPRLVVSAIMLLMFGYVLYKNPQNGLILGALIAMVTTVKDYWLGSSKGSTDKAEQLAGQAAGPAPKDVGEAADQTADAAVTRAAEIKGEAT